MTRMAIDPQHWFTHVPGDEHILLGRDSPLRRVPANVQPKHAIFLDGIRHAVEIMDVGYRRLRGALAQLALHPPRPEDFPLITAGIFLDAWAVVDAIDKFRQLYMGYPGMKSWNTSDQVQPLPEVLQTFRALRNVGDHLSQMSDRVLAKDGAALGELTWLTGTHLLPDVVAWHCVLRPGTLRSMPKLATAPIHSTLDWPTDYVCLTAGGQQGNLSTVRTHIAGRIKHLESQLSELFARPAQGKVPVMNDFFGRRAVKLTTPDES